MLTHKQNVEMKAPLHAGIFATVLCFHRSLSLIITITTIIIIIINTISVIIIISIIIINIVLGISVSPGIYSSDLL